MLWKIENDFGRHDWGIVENEADVNQSLKIIPNILNGAVKLRIPVCMRRPLKNNNKVVEYPIWGRIIT